MLRRSFLYFLCTLACLSLSSCNFSLRPYKDGFAPKSIAQTSFTFKYSKTNPDFKSIEGEYLSYFFHPDLTYESFLDNAPYLSGDYAYNRTGSDNGKLALSYTKGADVENETLHLYFTSKTKGNFEAIPYSKDLDLQEGTFTFDAHPTMPSSQNAACDKSMVDSDNT